MECVAYEFVSPEHSTKETTGWRDQDRHASRVVTLGLLRDGTGTGCVEQQLSTFAELRRRHRLDEAWTTEHGWRSAADALKRRGIFWIGIYYLPRRRPDWMIEVGRSSRSDVLKRMGVIMVHRP